MFNEGGVNITFANCQNPGSSRPMSLLKSYITIGHFIRSVKDYINPNTSFQTCSKSIKDIKGFCKKLMWICCETLKIIEDIGISPRLEFRFTSSYDEESPWVDLKNQGMEEWNYHFRKAYNHTRYGHMNIGLRESHQCQTLEDLLKNCATRVGAIERELSYRNGSKIKDCFPPGQILWLNAYLAMAMASAGYSGSSLNKMVVKWYVCYQFLPQHYAM